MYPNTQEVTGIVNINAKKQGIILLDISNITSFVTLTVFKLNFFLMSFIMFWDVINPSVAENDNIKPTFVIA